MIGLYILLLFTYISSTEIQKDEKLQEFIEFTKKYNKNYKTEEEFQIRFEIWKQNYKKIESANKPPKFSHQLKNKGIYKAYSPMQNTHFSINKFADLTQDEFKSKYLTFSPQFIQDMPIKTSAELGLEEEEEIPENFDWEKDKGIITAINDQKDCGCCYAIASVGVVESQYFIQFGENVSFSEQQIVDCDNSNNHCSGGNVKKAFNYLKNFGLMKDEDYPYINGEDVCKYDKRKTLVKVKAFGYLPRDEEEMKKALYKYGPIAGAINGIMTVFYESGIYVPTESDDYCPSDLNHAILIVGYGVDKRTGKKFWRIKNSLGQDWGENGYFRIVRGEGACGINKYSLIADIEKLN